jgi:isopentenyl diphosphate isomerase/L-lactate dehydrogenase-like FMN-dependent dehydrogenase
MAFTARSVASPRVININDLRRLAKRRVPRVVFDYLDGGAEGEVTLRENCRVFEDVTFRPRYAAAMSQCDLRTRVLGTDLAFPAILAPVGYSRLMHPAGEVAAASAAGSAGLIYTLSTISAHKLENVRAASTGPNSISSAAARLPKLASSARNVPVFPRSSSLSTRPSPACANAIREME